MKTCFIFGAADGLPEGLIKDSEDIVIAADAGIRHLKRLGIKPDIAVGDFDSLGFVPECGEIIKHPVMKNDTDTLLAVKVAFERGYRRIVLCGCYGQRPDHTLANYQVLSYISNRGGVGYLIGDGFTATAISDGRIRFSETAEGTVSVFSAVTESTGVFEKGLLYPLDDAVVSFDYPLGVSNEFTGVPSEIAVGSGTLIIIWNGGISDITENP